MIESFYLGLKSKPFEILAGISGARLTKLLAEAVGATTENGRYKMVPVRIGQTPPIFSGMWIEMETLFRGNS